MRAVAWMTILALGTVSAWGQGAQKKRVAVFDFDNAAVQGGISVPFIEMKAPDLGKAAADLLISKLVQDGNVSVIERNAIAQLAAQLTQTFPKLPPRTPVIEGLVADADGSGQLVLNVGAHDGVKLGDRLQVWRAGKEIRDPASNKLLMRDDTLLGEAVVTRVNDISSIAQYKGTEPVKIRDLVKSVPKQQ